jgi:hypothetical protein
MNCHDCEDLLQRHLADCANCCSLFAAAQRLSDGLRLVAAPVPPETLAKRTISRVLAEQRGRRHMRWAMAAAMMAACVLLAVWLWNRKSEQPGTVPVATRPEIKPVLPVVPEEPSLRDSVQEARHALDRLTDRVLDNTRKQVDVMRDATAPLEVGRADTAAKRAPNESKASRTRPGMNTGWQTVAATTRRGLSFIFNETPSVQTAKNDVE